MLLLTVTAWGTKLHSRPRWSGGGELGERFTSRAAPTPGPSTPGSPPARTPAAEEVLGDAGFAGKASCFTSDTCQILREASAPPTPRPLHSQGSWKFLFVRLLGGGRVSHTTRSGGDSALAFWAGGRSSQPPLHILMKATALGTLPRSLSHGEADGQLSPALPLPWSGSRPSSSSLTQALTLRCGPGAHGVSEGPNDDNASHVFRPGYTSRHV